jgi:hypothetical protein
MDNGNLEDNQQKTKIHAQVFNTIMKPETTEKPQTQISTVSNKPTKSQDYAEQDGEIT